MKRPHALHPRRPVAQSASVARSRKDAAIQLVRLEFDISRLEMAIDQAAQRSSAYRTELAEKSRQRMALMQILTE